MTTSFDDLYESLLTELTPVDIVPGYSGGGEETEAEFPEKSAGKYQLTPEQTKEVAKAVVDKLKSEGGHSDKTYKEFQEEDIAPIIKDVAGINMSNAKYAARVIHTALKSAGIITDERDGKATLTNGSPDEETLNDVADEAENTTATETDEEDQETISSEFEDEDTLEEPEADEEGEEEVSKESKFSPHADYYISPEDDIKAGTLSGDLRSVYDKLGGLAGETTTGSDIADRLRKAGIPHNKINGYLKSLVSKGVLEPQQGEGQGGSEALEGSEENMRDVERSTFNKHFSDAYQDYLKSGGGRDYGVDFG